MVPGPVPDRVLTVVARTGAGSHLPEPIRYSRTVELESRIRQHLDRGDLNSAATEAIRGYGPEVLTLLRAMLHAEDDAREAFGQFAEDVWRGLGAFRGVSSFRTWALRIARNTAISARTAAWRRRVRRLDTESVSALAAEVVTATAIRRERESRALERLRATLAPDEQALLFLRVDQGLSFADIAEVMEGDTPRPSPATLMKRYERLKARLRELARAEGLVE